MVEKRYHLELPLGTGCANPPPPAPALDTYLGVGKKKKLNSRSLSFGVRLGQK